MRKASPKDPTEKWIYCDICNVHLEESDERDICTVCESDVCKSHMRPYGQLGGGSYLGECCTGCLSKGEKFIKLMVGESHIFDTKISELRNKWRKEVSGNGKTGRKNNKH